LIPKQKKVTNKRIENSNKKEGKNRSFGEQIDTLEIGIKGIKSIHEKMRAITYRKRNLKTKNKIRRKRYIRSFYIDATNNKVKYNMIVLSSYVSLFYTPNESFRF